MSTAEHDQTKLGYIFVLVVQVALDRKLVKSISRGGSSPRNGFVLPVNINFTFIVGRGNPSPTFSNNNLSIPFVCANPPSKPKKNPLLGVLFG